MEEGKPRVSFIERSGTLDVQKLKSEELLKLLGTDLNNGLSGGEVERRIKEYGYNEIPEKRVNPAVRLLRKFWGLSVWMLEVMILLSWVLQKYFDLYILIALLVFNSILGFFEEQKASGAVEALKKRLQVTARVLRDGDWKRLPARELVLGDIVRVRSGDFVPADVKIIDGELGVDQSALTGESMEVEKRPDDLLYSGSIVKRGESNGVVASTGVKTYFGRVTQLVEIARPKLHIEEVTSKVVRWLLVITSALVGMALVFSILRGINLLEILPLMLILLLSAIPVALPAMFTVSMAVGSMELARKGVLITTLSASEDAATMDVLCVDKTGTITMNKLSIVNVTPLNGFEEREAILYGALASQEANQDPIDLAFISLGRQKNLMDDSFIQKTFVPFDPKTRMTEALVEHNGHIFRVIKGAVSVVAKSCGLHEVEIKDLEIKMGDFAKKGYRTLAVAKADGHNQPKLVGLVTLYDMPRPDSKKLIDELKGLAVSVKMLTGDALPIAKEISKKIGLGTNVIRILDLKESINKDPIKAAELAEESDGFAEIYPEDKFTIVKSLQAKGHVLGMTGDGVNDAPALKQAEVGIAVKDATDVAKGAASVVLTDEGLSNIVDLIKNGRKIYERVNIWILNKISRTILKSCFVVLAFFITGRYVVSAFAMILLVFMTDFVKVTLSTDNVKWSRKPNTWDITGLVKLAIILGLLMIMEAFGLLHIGSKYFGLFENESALATFVFETFFFFAVSSLFIVRERGHFWESKPSRTLLTAIILDMIVAIIISTFGIPGLEPLPIFQTISIIMYTFVSSLIINDFIKVILIDKFGFR